MALQDSPSLEDFSEGYQPPPDPGRARKRARIALGVVGTVLLILVVITFFQSGMAQDLSRRAPVSGHAIDETGNPIQAEVLVFGTDIEVLSDENGFFEIVRVPIGEQSIIVGYGKIAAEVIVVVQPGVDNSVGTVTVPTELEVFVDD